MQVTMTVELHYLGGGYIENEVVYSGDSLEEIAKDCDRDNNELLYYMQTHDDKGILSFCFGGFMFSKKGLIAARMYEPDF